MAKSRTTVENTKDEQIAVENGIQVDTGQINAPEVAQNTSNPINRGPDIDGGSGAMEPGVHPQSEPIGDGAITPAQAARSPHVTREKETGKAFSSDRFGQLARPPVERTESNAPEGQQQAGHTLRRTHDGQIDARTRMSGAVTNRNQALESDEELVRVRIKAYTKCKIGVTWFEFHPGRVYTVTQTVKDVLRRSNRLDIL